MTPFDDIYDQPDPRAYFRRLRPLAYQTPHHAQEVFRRLIAACRKATADPAEPITALDVCCSYGINAALVNHHLTLDDLYDHYASPDVESLTTDELIALDRAYYAARRRSDPARVIGLDAAAHAVSYAYAAGLLDAPFAENLETEPASPGLLRAARGIRLITVTGGASFLSPRTFEPLLAAAEGPVWVAAFALRTVSYDPIAAALARFGLVTESTERTFPQRRFTGADEQRDAVEAVTAAGHDPAGKESDGWFHTTLHVSRPVEDSRAFPISALMADDFSES